MEHIRGSAKAPFYIVLALVVAGLVYFAYQRFENAKDTGGQTQTTGTGGTSSTGGGGTGTGEAGSEAPDGQSVTTVQEYSFKPAERLPEVKGISAYEPLANNTVRFALNVWAGWGPIIFANEGFSPKKTWRTPDGKEFHVELVLIDNPVAMRDAYASGKVHIGWATLDMVPLFVDTFVDATGKPSDSRIMPRIYQQVDWSNGGDGIVARDNIKTVADLRGKQVVLAQNSPSHYFLLNMLVSGGVQPPEVKMTFTDDAFQAAAAFNANKDLSAAVSWAPDIYNLAKVKGNRMLVTTLTANKLIADVWFARADFAQDHGDIIEGLVRGIFDAMEAIKIDANRQQCARYMADGYGIPASEIMNMFADAHSTNWAENFQFFCNQNNPTNFERVWRQAYTLYRRVGSVRNPAVSFDKVMDFSIINKLAAEPKYSSQKDEYVVQFAPKTITEIQTESDEVLTNTVIIHFFPNDHNPRRKITEEVGGKKVERFYDPNVDFVLEDIARMTGQFGAAHIIIDGHTDASMKGKVNESAVRDLSMNRANAVKEELVNKFKLDPNQFAVKGSGWGKPADPGDPNNHAKNRRVEVHVYTPEKQ